MTHPDINLADLRQKLVEQFTLSELRNLAFDLGINHEELSGSTISDKARELIAYCQRTGRLPELVAAVQRLRPPPTQPKPPDTPTQTSNPFFANGRINNPDHFFGRQRLIREIQSELLNRALTDQNVILLLDEVERLAEPDFNPRLHDLLRALAQEPHFALCLVSQTPLLDLFPARTAGGVSPFHNIFTTHTLPTFTMTEAKTFLQTRLATTQIQFTAAEIDELVMESQGHPARLQRAAKRLFAIRMNQS